jgi:DNA polymerase III subunit gamma/tau
MSIPAKIPAASPPASRAPVSPARDAAEQRPTPAAAMAVPPETARANSVGPVTLKQIRDAWPEILGVLERRKRTAWMAAITAKVIDYRADDAVLTLGFPSQNDVQDLRGGTGAQSPAELLRAAIAEVLGVEVKFLPRVVGGQAQAPTASAPTTAGSSPTPHAATPAAPAVADGGSSPARGGSGSRPSTTSVAPAPHGEGTPIDAAPIGPVDSWATVTIPNDQTDAGAASAPSSDAAASTAQRATRSAVATAVAEAPVAASAIAEVPDDADAPPADVEPPFEPGATPEIVVESAPVVSAGPTAVEGGIQRYGESVVREVLGATFLEEVEAPGRPGFGERG